MSLTLQRVIAGSVALTCVMAATNCGVRTPLYENMLRDAQVPEAGPDATKDVQDGPNEAEAEVCVPLGGKCTGHPDCCGLQCILSTCVVKQSWCSEGQPPAQVAFMAEPLSVYAVEVDTTHVYFATDSGSVLRVSKGGGAVETLATGLDHPMAMVVDDTHLYVGDVVGMWRLPKTGGTAVMLAQSGGSAESICDTGNDISWTNQETGTVHHLWKTGGAAETASGLVRPTGIALGNLVADNALSSIAKINGWDKPLELLIKTDPLPWGVAGETANGRVFWSTACSPACGTIATSHDGEQTTLAWGLEAPMGILLDAVSVYWIGNSEQNASIGSVPKVGGAATTIVSQLGPASFVLAVDPSCVYWTDRTGRVMRAPKQP